MSRVTLAWILLLFLLAAPAQAFRRMAVGDVVEDFALVNFEGGIVKLHSTLGQRATVIVFWALWNPRSQGALRDLQELHHRFAGEGLVVVAVNVEHETWEPGEYERVARHVEESHLSFPVVVDYGLSLFDRYGVTVLPSMVITDPSGKVQRQMAGYPDSMRRGFREAVEQAVDSASRKPLSGEG